MDLETRSIWPVELEIRQDGRTISGYFPYGSGSMAVVADRGKVRKEYFRPRAFRFAVEDPTREINLLVGHDYGSLSRLSGAEHSTS